MPFQSLNLPPSWANFAQLGGKLRDISGIHYCRKHYPVGFFWLQMLRCSIWCTLKHSYRNFYDYFTSFTLPLSWNSLCLKMPCHPGCVKMNPQLPQILHCFDTCYTTQRNVNYSLSTIRNYKIRVWFWRRRWYLNADICLGFIVYL